MGEARYSRKAFWTIKVLALIALLIVIWNMAKESGRQEVLCKRPVQYLLNGNPACVWGEVIYPATQIDTKKMVVKIKRDHADLSGPASK